MAQVFISYRRNDSRASTGRIADRLRAHFGDSAIFQDIESISLGVDFRTALNERLDQCDVFLAIIGDEWMAADAEGKRRIDAEDDPVRMEIAAALLRKSVPVIPVLVGSSPIPAVEGLPDDLKELHYRNAIEIPSDDTFDAQVKRLCDSIESIIGKAEPAPGSAAAAPTTAPPTPGSSIGKIAGIAIGVIAILAGAWLFRCELLNQCADIYFDLELESTMRMTYGEKRDIQLVARNKKGDKLSELPKLDGRYDIRWASSVDRYVAIVPPELDTDPTVRTIYGIPEEGVEVGASVLSVVVENLKTGATQRPDPVTVTVFYDEKILDRIDTLAGNLSEAGVATSELIRDYTLLTTTDADKVPPGAVRTIEPKLVALQELEAAREAAESADPATVPVGERLQLWQAWAALMNSVRGLDASADDAAAEQIARLEETTRLAGDLKTYASCRSGSPPSCSNEKTDFSLNDELYIGMQYIHGDGQPRTSLALSIPGRDGRSVSASRQSGFTYTMVGARPAGENVEIKLFNSNGDLIGLTMVNIR